MVTNQEVAGIILSCDLRNIQNRSDVCSLENTHRLNLPLSGSNVPVDNICRFIPFFFFQAFYVKNN